MKNSNMALGLFALLVAYAQAALALHIGPTPIEVFQRPLIKSAPLMRTSSHAAQYAGRTTISSGSATQVVSTSVVNSDSLIYTLLQVALPAAYTTQGWAAIAAGAASATASTTAVYSGQQIDLMYSAVADQSSGIGRGFRVNSVVDGISFAVVTDDGQNVTSGPARVGWRIPDAIPQGLKVNTISSAGYFIFGWSDQKSRPVDVTAMWEIRRST